MTTHDRTHLSMIAAAARLGLVDAPGAAVLAVTHGIGPAMLDALSDRAEALQHGTRDEQATRGAWIKIRDAVRFFRRTDLVGDDKFGFCADATAKARAILEQHGVSIPAQIGA